MGILKTFSLGGIHPPENKISKSEVIESLPISKVVYIPLGQNLGAPAKAVVKRGDEVKVGQLIGKGEAFISANVHSSVSGKVKKIDNIVDTSGYKHPAIVIDVDGDEWLEDIDRSTDVKRDFNLDTAQIIEVIKEKGIVGLGGATFPSHVKLMVPDGKKADYLIINGVECEPYLTADHRIMLERGEEILIGISILMKGLGVEKALIGIENNKPDAIDNLSKLAKEFKGIEVHPLKVQYPQGGEKQLIKALVNREVPSGKLPIEVGCVVNNVGTALAIYEAVQKNKPLIERVVTVTGKSLKIVNGGPMMGKALVSLDAPIVKGSSGILLFKEEETKRVEVTNCIRCGKCISVCPMGLEPVLMAQFSENKMFENLEKELVMDCIECGSCQYTCPAGRPLLDYIRIGKSKVGNIIRNRRK